MSSIKREFDFPFDSDEQYELILGESFVSSRPNTGFHTIRYDFKPASVDTTQPGDLEVGKGGEVNVSLPNTQESGTTVYKGSKKPCPKECVLIVDKEKRTITLERLASTVQLKKIRSTSSAKGNNNSQSQGSQQSETLISQDETKVSTTNLPVDTSINNADTAESGESSNSSSSDSDSDDDEVAQLNEFLIDQSIVSQTDEEMKAINEPSSSFNLRQDLALSESESDSD